ncbi:hypothetical protein Ddye_002724 [Dipteronia dyeriana]|uniref:Uncharacterized protein n=1 Tax=Dipteronia dyeriana TaxID=168575 RepID=A0AAE0CUN6_9ROSI|nr:hypothetical protein Ddye_002724 [Dipteronia dyeriana]
MIKKKERGKREGTERYIDGEVQQDQRKLVSLSGEGARVDDNVKGSGLERSSRINKGEKEERKRNDRGPEKIANSSERLARTPANDAGTPYKQIQRQIGKKNQDPFMTCLLPDT